MKRKPMDMRSIKAKLREIAKDRRLVTIYRDKIEPYSLTGYILAITSNYILLHHVDDFLLDGYKILKVSDVSKFRLNRYDRYYARILRREGTESQVGLSFSITLKDWPSIFKSLRKKENNIIVENEETENELFIIGRIVRINQQSVTMLGFDATGKWYDETTNIKYSDITCVTFEDRYSTIFSKYLDT